MSRFLTVKEKIPKAIGKWLMDTVSGVIVATVTPFTQDGEKVDLEWIPQHLDYLKRNGADGVLIAGTNGEGSSLNVDERKAIVDTALENRNGLSIMVGTGFSSLPDTIEMSRYAIEQGADAALVVPPFYFKNISDVGLIEYYTALLDALPPDGKVVLYNIPKLSGVEITDRVVDALLDRYPSVFLGIKDTSGSIEQTRHFINKYPELMILSGSDIIVADALKSGAKGNVSATANVFPNLVNAILESHRNDESTDVPQVKLAAIRKTIDSYPSHGALKQALFHFAGLPFRWVRPPLRNLTQEEADELVRRLTAILEDD